MVTNGKNHEAKYDTFAYCAKPQPVLLFKDTKFRYYKFTVDKGTIMTEGKVVETCEEAGAGLKERMKRRYRVNLIPEYMILKNILKTFSMVPKKTLFHLLLKAVCAGPSSCKYTDTAKCVMTPISSRNTCRSPLSVTTCSSVVDMSRFIYLLSGTRCPWPCAILMTLGTARNWRESLLI